MKLAKIFLFIQLLGLSTIAMAIKPEREYKWTPDSRGLKYREYQVKTPDNYSINVWEYGLSDSVKTNRTIILVGTDAGNMSYLIWEARAFVAKGLRVISFDYRGFGKSSDFQINKDFLYHPEFALDLDTVIKMTREKYPTDNIGLFAMSMGTYVSLIRKEKIDFLVAEGFYHNPQAVVQRIKVNKNETVLLPDHSAKVRQLSPRIPVLIFSGSEDKTTTTADAKEFAKDNNVTLIEFKGGHLHGFHEMTRDEPGDEYAKRIVDFLKKNRL